MNAQTHRLTNGRLVAEFSPENGNLVSLAAPGGPTLLAGTWCRFWENETWTSEGPEEKAAPFEVVDVKLSDNSVESIARVRNIEVRRRFDLAPDAPLLKVSITVKGKGDPLACWTMGFPHVAFADGFVDVYEDDHDLYFDGEELGGGLELPPWRVFFRQGGEDGLLLATRCKRDMSRVLVLDDGFDIHPHDDVAYNTSSPITQNPLRFDAEREYTVAFELGPWQADAHETLLKDARLTEAVAVNGPPLSGCFDSALTGEVFDAIDFADADAVADEFARDKWLRVDMAFAHKGKALIAGSSVKPPALTLDPKLEGVYRVIVGIGNGDGVVIRLAGDIEATYRTSGVTGRTPFHLKLSGEHQAAEVFCKVADMTGKRLEILRFPSSYSRTVVDYVRFKKLSDAEAVAWRAMQKAEPALPLSGFNDIPDIASFTDARDPDPAAYRVNLWEHANCKVKKVYWRIDGQCSDYPSTLNTMRYISGKAHGVFTPQGKAYGRALKKTDMLKLAVQAARDYGLSMWGWQRFNNYGGNVQSDFYKNHPEFHEEYEHGVEARKLCLAYPAVRKHKIDILVEAASYGLDGVCLGFLRHPPILLYAPILVETFKQKYGKLPPRDPGNKGVMMPNRLPPDDEEHLRWFKHRADFMTLFGRELRAAFKENGLQKVKVAIWVRPNHCLHDGIDMNAWLDEGLCDEVVADHYGDRAVCRIDPKWKARVQSKVPLIRGTTGFDVNLAREDASEAIRDGFDGINIYESDYAVLDTDFINFLEELRK